MRYCKIIIFVVLVGCRSSSIPTSGGAVYSEDLSVHRPVVVEEDTVVQRLPDREVSFVPLEGHIGAELDHIIQYDIAQNKKGRLVEGFILQIYTGKDRDRANRVLGEMRQYFPRLASRISYRSPNFQVKAGRFTDRLAAFRTLELVKGKFPKALLVPTRFTITYE